jgi:hypothetical protein
MNNNKQESYNKNYVKMLKWTILVLEIISFKYNEHASKIVCRLKESWKGT